MNQVYQHLSIQSSHIVVINPFIFKQALFVYETETDLKDIYVPKKAQVKNYVGSYFQNL